MASQYQTLTGNKPTDNSSSPKDVATTSASKLTTPQLLAAKRRELEDLRSLDMREWALNRAFYNGNQWIFWNRISNLVETLPVQDGDKPRWKVRLTSNQIRPGVQHYVSQLTKTKPLISATPDSAGYRDVMAAQMASSLFDWWWVELQLRSKLQSGLVNSCISQGWWKITWDPLAGKSMTIMKDPTGKPITNMELSDLFKDELMAAANELGKDPKEFIQQYEQTIYVGDVRVEVLTGDNVLIDPAASDYTEARYAFCKHVMDVDQIQERYGVVVEPNASTASVLPLAFTRKQERQPKTVRDVFVGYFPPNGLQPKGRVVTWIEDPDKILSDDPWPYPFNDLPLVKFPGIEKPNSSTDEPIVSDARPLQKELNRTLSQIVQHKDMTIKPQMIAPVGSMGGQRLTDEPGAIFQYQPVQGLMPEWRPVPALPNSAMNILGDIQMRIDKMFNRMPTQRDTLPARIDSGNAVEAIQESVADQLSPVINRMEESLARAGKLLVILAQQYYIEPRLLKIQGENGATQVKKFMNSDLKGGFSFHAESGSGLPRSRAGRQQRILELVTAGLMDGKTATKYLDLADLKGVQAQLQADEDMAYREHEMIIKGEPTNPQNLQMAQQQAKQIMGQADPDGDGIPDSPQEKQQQIQQMLMQAAYAPTDFEDWDIHLRVHSNFMKSLEFRQLPPQTQQAFVTHFNETYQRIIDVRKMSLSLDPKVAPHVGLNMRATTSAAGASKILERLGVQASPQELSEPPLDTAVFDDLSKPNLDATANSPKDDAAAIMAMAQGQDKHQLDQAKSEHQHALAEQAGALTAAREAQQMRHAEEQHQQTQQQSAQRMRQEQQMHQAKLKNANKPKPAQKGK